jgi:hypothetical protein
MPHRFLHLVWSLVRFRYRLVWAGARTGSGRIALFFLLYVLLAIFGLFFVLGGFGAAVAGVQLGEGEAITRGVLTGLLVTAITTSLFFGIGSRAAFSDAALRRFPLSSTERLAVRHLIGLIDPIWFLLSASAFGLAVGLALAGAGSLVFGLVAAPLFIVASYLIAVLLLSIIDRVLQSSAGAALLSVLSLAALSFSGMAVLWVMQEHVLHAVDRGLSFAPSGLAAAAMAGKDLIAVGLNVTLLFIWCVLLLALVGWVERRPGSRHSLAVGKSGSLNLDSVYDRVADLFGAAMAPLVGKALRYYLRSNRVRFGLASTPVFAFLGRYLAHGTGDSFEFYFTLAFFSFLGFSGPSSMALNQFGSDDEGVKRYAVLPVSFGAPIRAGNIAALVLGGAVIPPAVAFWALITRVSVDWRMIVMLFGSSLAGLLLFNGLSMWTTVLSPRRIEFTSIMGNRLPLGGNLVLMGGFIVILGINFALLGVKLNTVLAHWWVPLAVAGAGLAVYIVSWWRIGPVAERQRARVIEKIAG